MWHLLKQSIYIIIIKTKHYENNDISEWSLIHCMFAYICFHFGNHKLKKQYKTNVKYIKNSSPSIKLQKREKKNKNKNGRKLY